MASTSGRLLNYVSVIFSLGVILEGIGVLNAVLEPGYGSVHRTALDGAMMMAPFTGIVIVACALGFAIPELARFADTLLERRRARVSPE